ncbi:hypothetical protein [Streptomyces atacamensis]|uniref:hypothetical protein n=1 Tax=Streptomyces atacamensis TaxID=531966 RepID=UPI00399C6A9F
MSSTSHGHQHDPQQPALPPRPGSAVSSPGTVALVGVVVLAVVFVGYLVAQHPSLNAPVVAAATVGMMLVAVLALILRR